MPWDRFTLPHGHALILAAYTALLTFASTLEGRALRAWTTGGTAVALSVVAGASVPMLPRISWAEAPLVPLALLLGSLVAASRTRSDASGPGGCAMGPVIRAGVFGFLLVDAVWLFGTGRFDAGFWLVLVYVAMRLLLLRARS
ncbi:MAG: hypothetical protein HMLKMBBP_03652 [Planctomycetes bacterium]|nr:hypothetical protein [Planctomycetota bacterium]